MRERGLSPQRSAISGVFEALGEVMHSVPHATRTLIGRERAGVRLVLAAYAAPAKERLQRIDAAFGLAAGDVVNCGSCLPELRKGLQVFLGARSTGVATM